MAANVFLFLTARARSLASRSSDFLRTQIEIGFLASHQLHVVRRHGEPELPVVPQIPIQQLPHSLIFRSSSLSQLRIFLHQVIRG